MARSIVGTPSSECVSSRGTPEREVVRHVRRHRANHEGRDRQRRPDEGQGGGDVTRREGHSSSLADPRRCRRQPRDGFPRDTATRVTGRVRSSHRVDDTHAIGRDRRGRPRDRFPEPSPPSSRVGAEPGRGRARQPALRPRERRGSVRARVAGGTSGRVSANPRSVRRSQSRRPASSMSTPAGSALRVHPHRIERRGLGRRRSRPQRPPRSPTGKANPDRRRSRCAHARRSATDSRPAPTIAMAGPADRRASAAASRRRRATMLAAGRRLAQRARA